MATIVNTETTVATGGDSETDGIGHPYYRTEVGEHENSESPYDTFDMDGNVWEWNEAILFGSFRGLRSGSFIGGGTYLHATSRYDIYPGGAVGFRVSEVPEPATLALLSLAGRPC